MIQVSFLSIVLVTGIIFVDGKAFVFEKIGINKLQDLFLVNHLPTFVIEFEFENEQNGNFITFAKLDF